MNKVIKKFYILLAPPNITSNLHLGHALEIFMSDSIGRCHNDYHILGGTDHAGIASEYMIKKEFNIINQEVIDIFEQRNKKIIINDLIQMNCNLNYDLFYFTKNKLFKEVLDEILDILLKKNLLFGENRLINWCVKCSTNLSDIEIEFSEIQQILYTIKYKTKNGYLEVATTRPETIEYDIALCTKKNIDSIYVINPITNLQIPILNENTTEENFGTGIFKLTPNCSKIDEQILNKHKIKYEKNNYIDDKNNYISKYFNQKFNELKDYKEFILSKLDIINEKNIKSIVPICYRCKKPIEYKYSNELFIDLTKINNENLSEIKHIFLPKAIFKTHLEWINNMKYWCISRNLQYGHKINLCWCHNKVEKKQCNNCNQKVFDTWLTSALCGIVHYKLTGIKEIDLLFVGKDLIFFWIQKMIIFQNLYNPDIKFKKIIFHGMLRDNKGVKFSKTLGNYQTLNQLINKYTLKELRLRLFLNYKNFEDTKINLDNPELTIFLQKLNKAINNLNKNLREENNTLYNNCLITQGFYNVILDYKYNITYFLNITNTKEAIMQWFKLYNEFKIAKQFISNDNISHLASAILFIFKWFSPEYIKEDIKFPNSVQYNKYANKYYEEKLKWSLKTKIINIESKQNIITKIKNLISHTKDLRKYHDYSLQNENSNKTIIHKIFNCEIEIKILIHQLSNLVDKNELENLIEIFKSLE